MFDSLFSAGSTVALPAWAALGAAPWLGRCQAGDMGNDGHRHSRRPRAGVLVADGDVLVRGRWRLQLAVGGACAVPASGPAHRRMVPLPRLRPVRGHVDRTRGRARGHRAGAAHSCFALTFLFGPVGLLAFLALRVAPACMALAREVHRRQPQLAWFGGLLLAVMVPALVAAWLDPRTLNGVGVWVKPLKFIGFGQPLRADHCMAARRPAARATRQPHRTRYRRGGDRHRASSGSATSLFFFFFFFFAARCPRAGLAFQ